MELGDPADRDSPHRTRPKVHVVIPAFNEGPSIGSLLDRIAETLEDSEVPYEVIVVDDGSADATSAIALERADCMPLHLVRHAVNQGLGATLRDGLFEAARRAGERDILVTMDADDTHTPGLILRMRRMIAEGYDVVIASRYRPESRSVGVPFGRRVLSRGASWLLRVLFPMRGVRDYTCGFRAYRAAVVKAAIARHGSALVDQEGFQCMVDLLLKLRGMRLIFGEVPFVLRYDFKQGGTKMKVGRTVWATLVLVVSRRLGR